MFLIEAAAHILTPSSSCLTKAAFIQPAATYRASLITVKNPQSSEKRLSLPAIRPAAPTEDPTALQFSAIIKSVHLCNDDSLLNQHERLKVFSVSVQF